MDLTNKKMRTALAANQHEIWAHWMRYQFSCCKTQDDGSLIIPTEKVERWKRQMETPFEDLPDGEEKSDYEQADKVIAVISSIADESCTI